MTKQEHAHQVLAGNIKPRVFQDAAGYVAWTPTWEGPARPDYAAACADLADQRWSIVNAPGSYEEYQYEIERPGGCGAFRRTREFDHYEGCGGRDPANCSGCALTDERQDAPNYAAWPLVYLENGRAIPSKWRAAFAYQQASENAAYADNIRAAIARYGVRWSDEA